MEEEITVERKKRSLEERKRSSLKEKKKSLLKKAQWRKRNGSVKESEKAH